MSNVQSYQKYLSSEYPGYLSFIENIIKPIFGSKFEANAGLLQKASNAKLVDRFENIIRNSSDELLKQEAQNSGLTSMIKLGSIELDNTEVPLLVYDITISESKDLAKNRKGIQSLTRRMLEKNSGAFMIFHYADKLWEWRFSYCFKGMSDDDSTNAKRFTYLLGPNQACRTAAQRFDKLRKQNGSIKLQDIENAFSVEALSKEFFEKYKVHYGRFVGYVIGKEYVDKGEGKGEWREKEGLAPSELFAGLKNDEKVVRDYVKKLLGRIVFLHFLQKKGWLGATDAEWTDGPQDFMSRLFDKASEEQKDNFLDDILEPLFSCLDTPLDERNDVFDTKVEGLRSVRVPFLGGLFERDEQDKADSVFPKELFEGLFVFLGEYNFTIDENDPNDAQVSVDPEMLGRIFENLLEDNKDKGAFYTPKEIVQYMCRESLIAYLQTDVTDEPTREALRQFVTSHDVALLGGRGSALAQNVSQCLKDVKICDPAIGSGAFPMGLLNELFLCRGVIEDFSNAAEIKRHIIQQNIYGVDIEKGAVEIARLRFWLSLITDAETPKVLPNLDFKIMQGNSLLEQYKGFDLSHIMDTKTEIHGGHQYQMFDEQVDVIRAEVKKSIDKYYSEKNHSIRRMMRDTIQMQIQRQISTQGIELDISDIKDISATSDFFLWHTWFADVFDEGGFDIVIGNPPYNELRDLSQKAQEAYKKSNYHKYAKGGRVNMFQYFYPLGIDMCNPDGIICLITQNSLLAEDSALENRKLFFENTSIISIDSYPERDDKNKRVFESAKMSVCFCVLRNNPSFQIIPINITIWEERQMLHSRKLKITTKEIKDVFQEDLTIPICDQTQLDILVKMRNKSDDSMYNISAGEIDMTKYKNYFSYEPSSDKTRIVTGAQVLRYHITNNPSQGGVKYVPSSCLSFSHNRLLEVNAPRLVMQRITGVDSKIRLIATLLPKGMCCANSTNYISSLKNTLPLNVLLAILNSTAANYIFKATSTNTNVTSKEIGKIPIPIMNEEDKEDLSALVDRILVAKKANPLADTTAEECEIDRLVYDLYGLTEDEIKIVEGKNE